MCTGQDYLDQIANTLGLSRLKNADSTLLSEYVVRIYFDDCIQPDMVDGFKDKIAHCCDIELYNCHIVDIVKREPFIHL